MARPGYADGGRVSVIVLDKQSPTADSRQGVFLQLGGWARV